MERSPARLLKALVVIRSFSGWIWPFVFATACDPGGTVSEQRHPPAVWSTAKKCESSEIVVSDECFAVPDVKVNSVGYLTGRVKRATVPVVDGIETFAIVSAETDEVVFEGSLAAATANADTADTTRVADFTDFDTPGSYVLRVAGLAPSPVFRIGDDTMNEPLRVTMLGLYGQRCGVAVEFDHHGDTFKHGACHVHDAMRDGKAVDGTGGWHDAGDYGKYTVNAAFALAFVLKAWEDFGDGLATLEHIPKYAGTLPAWLDEAKFQLDQILKMQLPHGGAAHMIGSASWPGMVLPESDTSVRAFSQISGAATADLAAVAAMASRVFRRYDPGYADQCLAAALLAQAYLDQNPSVPEPSFDKFTHRAYMPADDDDRIWAQVELWRTTSDPDLLNRIEASLGTSVNINFDWDRLRNLAMFSYVQASSDARDPARLEEVKLAIKDSADKLVSGAERHAYGRAIEQMYYWGSNGVLARTAINLMVANAILPDARYLDAAIQQIDFILGRNPFGRSFVTGLGYLPAQKPHHRPSEADRVVRPWPGLLVGGPNPGKNDDDPVKLQRAEGLASGLVWFDDASSFGTNEVAINWNTALAYALAGFYR